MQDYLKLELKATEELHAQCIQIYNSYEYTRLIEAEHCRRTNRIYSLERYYEQAAKREELADNLRNASKAVQTAPVGAGTQTANSTNPQP